MKHTPAEQKALDAAKNIKTLPAAEYVAIRQTPAAQRTVTQRRAMLEDDLKHAAEAFESRERSNDLYRHYLRKGDRSEARWHAPSPLSPRHRTSAATSSKRGKTCSNSNACPSRRVYGQSRSVGGRAYAFSSCSKCSAPSNGMAARSATGTGRPARTSFTPG